MATANRRRRAAGSGDRLAARVNQALALKYRDGTPAERTEAREAMVRGNSGLVHDIAFMYARIFGVDKADLAQEGILGLLTAIERYDPERSTAFSTYSYEWIRGSISKAAAEMATTVRLTDHARSTYRKRSEAVIRDAERANSTLSIDGEAPGGGTYAATLIAREGQAAIDRREAANYVHAAMKRLPARQREVIRLRFGFGGTREHSLEEVGREIGGVTKERARQLLVEATKTLRKMPRLMEVAS